MEKDALKKLQYKFFKEFCPDRVYVRYQIIFPYYTQAPSKSRLVEIVKQEKERGCKIKIGEVWWSMPPIRYYELIAIEETIAMLCRCNSNGKFQNGLEYFYPSKEDSISKDNGFYYEKRGVLSKGQMSIQIGGKNRLEALLRLCLHKDIKDFIRKDIEQIFRGGLWLN